MKVIPQTCHSHYIIYLRFYFYFTMSVPDEGYSTNTSFTLHYISSFLFLIYYERTWWRLFHKHVIHTTLAIFVSIFILLWAYLMKVIPQTCHSYYIINLRFYFYFTMSDEGYSTNTSFALHYISSFLFLFYYERTWWRLFHKHVIHTTLYIFVSIFILLWAYLWRLFHKHVIRTTLYIFASIFILLWAYLMKLFHKHVIRTTLYIFVSVFILLWAYLMKVIPQTRHSHYIIYYFYFRMSIPDEGYSTNTSFALHYISSFLFLFYYERTWWRLFHKHVIHTTLDIFVSIFILLWAYLMKVIPQTRHSHYIIYLRFYFYFTMSVPDEGYSTNMSFALHYISSFLFLFYYERTMKVIPQTRHSTTLYIFVSIFILLWAYLMKVIPQTRHSHYIIYLRFVSIFALFYYERTWWRLFHKHVIRTTLYIFVSIFILLWAYLMKVIPQTRHSHYIIYLRFYFYFTMSVPDEGYSTNTSFTLH